MTVLGSLAVGEALLILKILFLLLLYLFIWRIVRTASRDLRLPQESFVLAPEQAAGLLGALEARQHRSPRLPRRPEARTRLAHALGRAQRRQRHPAGRRLRVGASRPARAEARRSLGLGRRLDERHVRERHEAGETAAAEARRRDPRRQHRPPLRALTDEADPACRRHRPGPPSSAKRGRLRRPAAALRGRRRHGRRPGRRDRLADRCLGAPRLRPGGRRGRGRRADPGGEQARLRSGHERRGPRGDGDDDDRRAGRGRHRQDRPCRRLPRLPGPGRRPAAADRRPLPRRRARPQRAALAGGSRCPPAALRDHTGARHRPGGGRRHLRGRGAPRGRLHDLLGRPDVDGRRRVDPRRSRAQPHEPRPDRPRARRRREQGRRRGQHHRDRLRARRRRRGGGAARPRSPMPPRRTTKSAR